MLDRKQAVSNGWGLTLKIRLPGKISGRQLFLNDVGGLVDQQPKCQAYQCVSMLNSSMSL